MSRPSASSDAAALLRTPRWIGLTLLLIALTALFAVASSWQYNRAIDQVNAERAANARPEPIDALVPDADQVPPASLGRLAVVSGQYRGDAWVAGRASPSGEPGWWLVSAVDDGSGLLTPVLRGWLAEREPSGAAPWRGQQVTVTGRVSSAENFYTGVEANQPDELVAITNERLAAIWQQPMRAGYLVLAEQQPPLAAGDPIPVKPVFGTDPQAQFPWQNAGYAAQWLGFIGFAGFMYWRLLRDDLARLGEARAGQPAGPQGAARDR